MKIKIFSLFFVLALLLTACDPEPTPKVVYVEVTSTPIPATDTPVPTNTPKPTNTPIPTDTPEPTPTDIPCVHTLESIEDEFGITFVDVSDEGNYYDYDGGARIGDGVLILFRANVDRYGCVTEAGVVIRVDVNNYQDENVKEALGYMEAYAHYIDPVNAEDVIEGIPAIMASDLCKYGESNSFTNERPDGTVYTFECISGNGYVFWGLHIELKATSING